MGKFHLYCKCMHKFFGRVRSIVFDIVYCRLPGRMRMIALMYDVLLRNTV